MMCLRVEEIYYVHLIKLKVFLYIKNGVPDDQLDKNIIIYWEINNMLIKSKISDLEYEEEDGIKIPNLLQAFKYWINGVSPIDVIYTDRLVLVFERKNTKNVFDKWCKKEL